MERTNWTLLCGASHCCSFECITGVKCVVQDGHVGCGDGGGNRQRRRTDCSCRGIPFIQEGGGGRTDGRGDIETQECIVLFPIGLNIGRRGERGGRRAAGAGGRRPSARPSVSPAGERTGGRASSSGPIPILSSARPPSVPTLTGNTRWRKLSGDSDRAPCGRRTGDGAGEAATAFEEREWRLTRGISLLSLFAVFYCLQTSEI